MRTKLIAGNWKMNGTRQSIEQQLQILILGLPAAVPTLEIVVFPPFIYCPFVKQIIQHAPLKWGAQTVSAHPLGAYTGEIAVEMLQDFACDYVLLGHSERRHGGGENDLLIAQQFARVTETTTSITPILCVGERLEERESGRTEAIITQQIQACISDSVKDKQFAIAYEPVWAIGTGVTASTEQIQSVHTLIRKLLNKIDKSMAERTQILYGGSVKPDNAGELMALPDVDGVLVGGASLHAEQFLRIIQSQLKRP